MQETTSTPRASRARERLLETACALFYAEGIRAVGVERVVSEAKVTRATFYRHFPGKDELVRAYLEREHERITAMLAAAAASATGPRHLLELALAGVVAYISDCGFRGCAFINASAEYTDPAHPVRQVIQLHRTWFYGALRELLIANDHPDPGGGARALVLLRDGATVGASLDELEPVRAAFLAAARAVCGLTA
jgi:AcrR family transcriptional regulator